MARQIGEGISLVPSKTTAEVINYVSAFYYALSPLLKEVSDGDEHIMRVCSLLAIPPPPPGMPVRHLEIPMDLNTMRLPDWVNNVRDLATGLVMLPPTFLVTGKVIQSSVLPKLERVAGVKACRFCLHPHTVCGCSQISAWSHTSTRQTPAMTTSAHSNDSTSVCASTHAPPGLSSHGAAAPTSTYSEALVLTPLPHMRGVSQPPLPRAGYPTVGFHQMTQTPEWMLQSDRSTQCPPERSRKLPINSKCKPQSLPPIPLGWERSHPHNDKEVTGAGVPDHYHRPWLRALHQESGGPSPD